MLLLVSRKYLLCFIGSEIRPRANASTSRAFPKTPNIRSSLGASSSSFLVHETGRVKAASVGANVEAWRRDSG